ncbi:calcium/sodium antiporter [Tenacibaculum finnmarkense genomovar finnmarkense]|uniref:calcium/sodium antiporter n=1 Tax=Tenacibaculum finnmarkense TaxID=2781243 RepID=UPI001E29BB1B|nr:calcium/sodium antiporter [Tenacibaculum finnmarkense]MCD8418484.1 calcium/sodium antiporter [Tenacibaculum finnmarkense genomovar finnmarkense]MCG8185143.1 calcium/sodium antiporter [Tenacibaculum finnmarkense genomovar finnmarkense]MCG8201024.1 calcium/sodium antiporter [Tenacibaculum finnmarkense genomovar finnmarkense]MCG8209102.1 calcium/sodium antiporter [Tenacibaculum finnmarkense genomovar finnmarkense]MCG8211583.1 calcium/sodium antiporter [Tenacibaculum finnmarkense genomovar finn
MDIVYIALGLLLLVLGGNWLLKAAVGLSLKLNIPKVVIGMTVVSFATSAPELIVSIKSALNGAPGLAVGNVIGSNIANIGLVLGITLILSTIEVEKNFYKTDWPVMMVASGLLYFFIAFDNTIEQYEGIILFSMLVVFLVYLLRFQKTAVVDEMPEDDEELPLYKVVLFLSIGSFCLWLGSEWLIDGATNLAKNMGVSDAIIGVTVVSVGTSVPELAASIIAVLKKEKAISLGNLIGSNVFNILAVLGITSIITPIKLGTDALSLVNNDIYWMLAISFIVLPFAFFPKKLRLNWVHGIILLVAYTVFVYLKLS